MSLNLLGVETVSTGERRRPRGLGVTTAVGAAAGAVVGGYFGHPVMGALATASLARNGHRLFARESTPGEAALRVAPVAVATAASLAVPVLPAATYLAGYLGSRYAIDRFTGKSSSLGSARDMLAGLIGADVSADDVRSGRAILKQGSSGPAVALVQLAVGVTADGKYGPATETAVRAFQARNGLVQDGVVGRETMAAVDRAGTAASSPSTALAPPAKAPAVFSQTSGSGPVVMEEGPKVAPWKIALGFGAAGAVVTGAVLAGLAHFAVK